MSLIEHYIALLPEREKSITIYLRNIILGTSPKFTEKLSYGVPYYFIHSRVCFTWPAISPLSNFSEGVVFGICRGNKMANLHGLLSMGNRKEVAMVNFTATSQISEDIIREVLFEAIEIDERVYRERKKK